MCQLVPGVTDSMGTKTRVRNFLWPSGTWGKFRELNDSLALDINGVCNIRLYESVITPIFSTRTSPKSHSRVLEKNSIIATKFFETIFLLIAECTQDAKVNKICHIIVPWEQLTA